MKKGNIKLVAFDPSSHRYSYCGKELRGVTAIIGKTLGKNYPSTALVALSCSYGTQVHKEIERWIEEGKEPDMLESIWLIDRLRDFHAKHALTAKYSAEVRVSDFEGTASNVDAVLHTPEGVFIFDFKTGRFDRQYCTLQLNAYRLMYGNCYPEKVLGMFVLHTKSRRLFTIHACEDKIILNLLERNK